MADQAMDQTPATGNTTQSRPRKKRSSALVFQVGLIAVFLTVVWFSFGQWVLAPRNEGSVPDRLGGMSLISNVGGDEALAQVDRLHGTGIDLLTARIIEYGTDSERLTVWVGRAESQEAATDLLTRMIDGITRGGSGFSNVRRIKIGTHDVYQVDGPGGNHFFYQSMDPGTSVYGRVGSGTGVVWLSAQAADPLRLLEQAMEWF